MRELIIKEKDAGQRMDKYLIKYMPLANLGFFYKMLRKKNIVLNDKKAEGKEILKSGDAIKMYLAEDTIQSFQKSQEELKRKEDEYQKAYATIKNVQVLYENKHILIVDKPAGVLSQKSEPKDVSVNEWAIGYLLDKGKIDSKELETFKPSIVNRLDRNTSGVLMIGKTLKGSQDLSEIIKSHEIGKFYRTMVHGKMERAQMQLKGYLVKDHQSNKVTVKPQGDGDLIETHYSVLDSFAIDGKWYSYLEIQLITGKSHQIRAHLASIGHPLVGDEKYGKESTAKGWQKKLGIRGQILHAYRLELPKSVQERLQMHVNQITAPLPRVFTKIMHDA